MVTSRFCSSAGKGAEDGRSPRSAPLGMVDTGGTAAVVVAPVAAAVAAAAAAAVGAVVGVATTKGAPRPVKTRCAAAGKGTAAAVTATATAVATAASRAQTGRIVAVAPGDKGREKSEWDGEGGDGWEEWGGGKGERLGAARHGSRNRAVAMSGKRGQSGGERTRTRSTRHCWPTDDTRCGAVPERKRERRGLWREAARRVTARVSCHARARQGGHLGRRFPLSSPRGLAFWWGVSRGRFRAAGRPKRRLASQPGLRPTAHLPANR